MLGYQALFYGVVFILGYWIVTFNWKWLLISGIVSFLQLPIRNKNKAYVNFVLDYLRPQDFFAV